MPVNGYRPDDSLRTFVSITAFMAQDNTRRFSNRVTDYIKYRPAYPAAVVPYLEGQQGFAAGMHIADIGAGTGISAALFLDAGYRVTAVEPNEEMRTASVALLGRHHGFAATGGTAEDTGLPGATVDAVVSGQAFHWFDAVATAREWRRILKKDGPAVLMWNERITESAFERAYDLLIQKHARDYTLVQHRNIDLSGIQAFFAPGPVAYAVFPNSQSFDYAGLEGRLLSSSYMPSRDSSGFEAMVADLKILFSHYQQQDRIIIRYNTKVYTGRFS